MSWSKSVPTSASYVFNLASELPNNWGAIDAILTKEHYPLTAGASLGGRHRKVGAILVDTTANVNALSATATSGALAFDTTTGEGKLFLASQTPNFYPIHLYDRICTHATGYSVVPDGVTSMTVSFVQDEEMTQATLDRWVPHVGSTGNKWVGIIWFILEQPLLIVVPRITVFLT
jgi:hypothetical protein